MGTEEEGGIIVIDERDGGAVVTNSYDALYKAPTDGTVYQATIICEILIDGRFPNESLSRSIYNFYGCL